MSACVGVSKRSLLRHSPEWTKVNIVQRGRAFLCRQDKHTNLMFVWFLMRFVAAHISMRNITGVVRNFFSFVFVWTVKWSTFYLYIEIKVRVALHMHGSKVNTLHAKECLSLERHLISIQYFLHVSSALSCPRDSRVRSNTNFTSNISASFHSRTNK